MLHNISILTWVQKLTKVSPPIHFELVPFLRDKSYHCMSNFNDIAKL